MKGLYFGIFLLLSSILVSAQTVTSVQNGDWDDVNTWDCGCIPDSGSDDIFVANVVTIANQDVSADQITVQNGGEIILNNGFTLTLEEDFTSPPLTIQSGGTLTNNGTLDLSFLIISAVSVQGAIDNAGTIAVGDPLFLSFESGSTYRHNHSTGGEIPLATWDENSTAIISGLSGTPTLPTNLNQSFGNFTWNTAGLTASPFSLQGQLTEVRGDLVIANTNSRQLVIDDTGSGYTLNIGRDFIIQGTSTVLLTSALSSNSIVNVSRHFSFSGLQLRFSTNNNSKVSLRIAGDFTKSAGSILRGTPSTGPTTEFVFDGSQQAFTYSGTNVSGAVDFLISTGTTVNAGTSAFTGAGAFTLQSGATLGVGSPDGLVTGTTLGNVRVTGARNYTPGGNIVYNSNVAQNLGNEWGSTGALNGVAVNLEIANTHPSGVTNNIIGNTSLVGDLTLTSGVLNIGNSNTLIIQSNFAATGGTVGGLSTSNLTFANAGTITGSLNFAAGAQNLNTLTISRDATIALGTPLTIGGSLAFTEAGELRFYGQTLTINGDITQTGGGVSGGLEGNSTSNLIVGGTGALSKLPFVNSSQLSNLTLGRTNSGTYTLGSAITVNGTLALDAGTLTHTSGLIMANGSTFSRKGGASITTNPPSTSGSYNVTYSGDLTTGLELPSSATALSNLTVSGNVTLDKGVRINGDVNINSGTLNASTFDVAMAGSNFLVNGGTFTMGSTHKITFLRAGTTVLGGTTVNGIQFGNLTINSGATLSAPNAEMSVAGTWDNLGSFTPNTGTVVFNGGSQNIDASGQPFYNVTFAGTGTKMLQGALDVNNILTISSTLDAGGDQPIFVGGSWVNNGIFLAEAGTVTFDGSDQAINSVGQAFYNLQFAGSGTKSLESAINIDGAMTINSGVTFDVSTSNFGISLAGDWINNGTFSKRTGTVTFDGTSTISGSTQTNFQHVVISGALTAAPGTTNVHGDWTASGTFNANGGTIQFAGGNQSITPGGQAFNNIVVLGTNTKTLQGDIDINGNLTLSASTFSVGSNRAVNLAGNFDASGGGALAAQNGTFVFDGDAQSITSAGETFFNVTFAASGTKTLTDAFDANGNMDIRRPISAGANTINVAGNWNATLAGSLASTGTTTFDGAAQNIRSNLGSFGTLVLAGSGTKTLQDALDANGSLTITSSTLDVSTSNFPITVGGDWYSFAGVFNARGGLVTLDGGAQNITMGANSFNSLTVAGTGVKTLLSALDVNGTLTFANATSGLNVGSDQAIRVAGNWVNNSGITTAFTAGNGTVTFDGGATSDVSGTASTVFHAIDVTGSTNVEIETAHSITGTLTLVGLSSKFDADGSGNAGVFTLVSSADEPTVDARVASLPVPGNFTGNVTVQRFMSKETQIGLTNNRIYRYISSPVANAPVSDIQQEIPVTGSFAGASSCAGCGTNDPSMFYYDEQAGTTFEDGWTAFPSVSNTQTLEMGRGYALFVWGNVVPTARWDVRGPIFSGNVSLPLTYENVGVAGADGFNLVGNPYPSAIDWDLIKSAAVGLADAVYIRDEESGIYTAYVNGVGTNGGSKDIAMGQAFWVQATAPSPQLVLNESMKSSASPVFYRVAPPGDLLRVTMRQASMSDELVIRFDDAASDEFDPQYDAKKLPNSIFNFSSLLPDQSKVAINTLGAVGCGRQIPLDVANVKTGHYELSFEGMDSFDADVSIRLIDSYTGQVIDPKVSAIYGFDVDASRPETFGADRLSLTLEFSATVTAPTVNVTDVCQGAAAQIELLGTSPDVYYSVYANGNLIADIGSGNGGQLTGAISQDKLAEGVNTFELRAVNTTCADIAVKQTFEIESEAIPQVKSISGGRSCGEGNVSVVAGGAEEGSYKWYESMDDVEPIAGVTGSVFTTPVLSKTKTYYVSGVNSLGCEGPRTEVVAEVVNFEPVTVEELEGRLVSSYETGNQWFKDGELIENATSKTFTPNESGTYSVEVKVGECVTSAEWSFLVTANEELASSAVKIYPNPVKNQLVIRTRFEQSEPPVISDPTGKIIGEIKMVPVEDGWEGNFDFSGHSRGIYILRVTEKGVVKYKRIVKE